MDTVSHSAHGYLTETSYCSSEPFPLTAPVEESITITPQAAAATHDDQKVGQLSTS